MASSTPPPHPVTAALSASRPNNSDLDIQNALSSTPTSPSFPSLVTPGPIQGGSPLSGAETGEEKDVIGAGEQVEVELLLVSGKRRRWCFGSEATIREVREQVWRNWPEEWRGQEDLPPSMDALRILYLGKFLDDSSTLSSHGVHAGTVTVLQLVVRILQPDYDEDNLKSTKDAANNGGMCNCCILS